MNLQKILRAIVVSALFLIPIFPLIVVNSYFFPFITGKAFYFRILVEIAFAGWVILTFLDAKYRPKLNGLTIGITVFAIVALVADLLGVNPLRSIWSNFERMEGWLTIAHLWMFFVAATNIFGASPIDGSGGHKLWHRWLNFSLIISVIVALYGFAQIFGWAAIHQGSVRIDASLGNAIYMAVYMLFHGFISVYLLFAERAKGVSASLAKQWLYGIFAVVAAFMIFQTATRGTILGLIGGVLLALFLYSVFGKGESKKWRWFSAGIIGAIIVIGIIFWSIRSAPFIQNSQVLGRLANISWNETKTQARAYVWPMALTGASQRPILGWGQENFNYVFNANYNPKMWGQEQWFDRAHSIYLDWLINGGIVGLVAYLALYALAFLGIWRSSLTIAEKSVLSGLVAGYMIHNVFVFDNLASYVFFIAILGFISSWKEGRPVRWMGTEPVRTDAVEYIVAPIAIILLVAAVYFLNVRTIQANTRLITALRSCSSNGKPDAALFERALSIDSYTANQETREQVLSCTGSVIAGSYPGPTKQAFFDLATKEIQAQIDVAPNDARIYALGGTLMAQVGQSAAALGLLETAHKLSPAKQSIDYPLASVYLSTGKLDESLALIKEAYESAPENPTARENYAVALIRSGKEAEALKSFGDEPQLFVSEQVGQTYFSLKQYDKAIDVYKKLSVSEPTNVQWSIRVAQVQYAAGRISSAIETMRNLEKNHPELKDQIEAAIKQIK